MVVLLLNGHVRKRVKFEIELLIKYVNTNSKSKLERDRLSKIIKKGSVKSK